MITLVEIQTAYILRFASHEDAIESSTLSYGENFCYCLFILVKIHLQIFKYA